MAKRYSNILQAAKLKTALDNYLAHISKGQQQTNVGNGKAKATTTELFVRPFGASLAAKQYAKTSGDSAAWTNGKTNFAKRTLATLDAGTETSIKLKGFRAARFVLRTGMKASGTVKTAVATKSKYLDYGGTSVSIPFGQKDATTETESTAFAELKTAYKTTLDTVGNRAYWSREKY